MYRSSIRRINTARLIFGLISLVIYQSLTSIFALPPLLGVFFVYLISLNLKREKRLIINEYEWYFCLLYLIFIEQTHGFVLFSTLLGCIFFYYFVSDYLLVSLKSRILLIGSFVVGGYVCTFGFSSLFGYIGGFDVPKINSEIFVYLVVEIIIAVILFKDRFA